MAGAGRGAGGVHAIGEQTARPATISSCHDAPAYTTPFIRCYPRLGNPCSICVDRPLPAANRTSPAAECQCFPQYRRHGTNLAEELPPAPHDWDKLQMRTQHLNTPDVSTTRLVDCDSVAQRQNLETSTSRLRKSKVTSFQSAPRTRRSSGPR